jgi:succinoglycan biosynthesis transport protein ExoP
MSNFSYKRGKKMTQSLNPYEDEIDLRRLVRVVLTRWYWIAIATVLTAAVALGVSLIMPKQFRASSAVAIVKPDVIFRFEAKIATEVEIPQSKGVPDLAMSDSVLQAVIDSPAGASLDPDDVYVDVLRERLETSLADTIVNLLVEDTDPARTAALANAWAEATAQKLNELYLPSSLEQGMFAQQAEAARLVWNNAQRALIAFQDNNPERVLLQRLRVLESKLAWTLQSERTLETVVQDARSILARLDGSDSESLADLTDDLATLILTSRSLLSTTSVSDTSAMSISVQPLEFQLLLDGGSILQMTTAEQAGYLDSIILSLDEQAEVLATSVAGVENEIYDLQGKYTEAYEQRTYLEQERDLARDAYQALARKAQESDLTTQSQDAVARVASRAVAPTEEIGPRIELNTALGGVLGFIVGITWVFLADWWREE